MAIEGVQPAIVQNPTPAGNFLFPFFALVLAQLTILACLDIKAASAETLQPGASRTLLSAASSNLNHDSSNTNAISGVGGVLRGPVMAEGTVNGEPLVKSVLSKELQMYYDKIIESLLSPTPELRNLAMESLSKDPGIQPLMPYFIQFLTDKVTKNVRNLQILWTMMRMIRALLDNKNLFIEPYVS